MLISLSSAAFFYKTITFKSNIFALFFWKLKMILFLLCLLHYLRFLSFCVYADTSLRRILLCLFFWLCRPKWKESAMYLPHNYYTLIKREKKWCTFAYFPFPIFYRISYSFRKSAWKIYFERKSSRQVMINESP
jgi:hypothetical protein